MDSNVEAAANDNNIMPAKPAALQQQIVDASKQSAATAQKGIEASGSYGRAPLFPVSGPQWTASRPGHMI